MPAKGGLVFLALLLVVAPAHAQSSVPRPFTRCLPVDSIGTPFTLQVSSSDHELHAWLRFSIHRAPFDLVCMNRTDSTGQFVGRLPRGDHELALSSPVMLSTREFPFAVGEEPVVLSISVSPANPIADCRQSQSCRAFLDYRADGMPLGDLDTRMRALLHRLALVIGARPSVEGSAERMPACVFGSEEVRDAVRQAYGRVVTWEECRGRPPNDAPPEPHRFRLTSTGESALLTEAWGYLKVAPTIYEVEGAYWRGADSVNRFECRVRLIDDVPSPEACIVGWLR